MCLNFVKKEGGGKCVCITYRLKFRGRHHDREPTNKDNHDIQDIPKIAEIAPSMAHEAHHSWFKYHFESEQNVEDDVRDE